MDNQSGSFARKTGSLSGFFLTIAVGFVLYFTLNLFHGAGNWFQYDVVVANVETSLFYKLAWFTMNFTEAQFYAGVFASLFMVLGGIIAWRLDVVKSTRQGFDICYGTNMFPWVLASQLLSLGFTIFIFRYTHLLGTGEYTWLPTFITVVAVPPSLMLLYGPSYRALFTGSILSALVSYPIAFWIMDRIIPVINVPGVVANVTTMAITGIAVVKVCHLLPWMKKVPCPIIDKDEPELTEDEKRKAMSKPSWSLRRALADFTEALFYGNEIAGAFVIIGVSIDWILNAGHPGYGSGVLPAIILSQFIAAAVGIYLYFDKWVVNGFAGTFVPVVSVGPACVLMFGGTIPVALFAGIMGGVLGAPIAEYLFDRLVATPEEDYHPTVGNVSAMAVCTIIVSVVMQALPWF